MFTRYTNAQDAYDGFGTTSEPTTLKVVQGMNQGPLRKVTIRPEHYNWQTTRYFSGGNLCLEEKELGTFKKLGVIEESKEEPCDQS